MSAVVMGAKDVELARLAASQHGVFTLGHARAQGFSKHEVDRRRSTEQWVRVHHVAYRMAGAPTSWRGALLAACWAGGTRAHASHRSGAAIWNLPGGSRDLAEITCPRWRRARHDGLVVHETKAFDPRDVTHVDNVPVSTPARTLMDLGAVRGPHTVELALEVALHRELVTMDEVREVLWRLSRSGRNGAGVLRSVVRTRAPGAAATESPMETRVIQLLRAYGFPEPQRQFVIRAGGRFVARVDLAFPQWRVAIEYDSYEWHLGAAALQRDSARRNDLVGVGWRVLTATAADVRIGGGELCRTLRTLVRTFGVAEQA